MKNLSSLEKIFLKHTVLKHISLQERKLTMRKQILERTGFENPLLIANRNTAVCTNELKLALDLLLSYLVVLQVLLVICIHLG